MNLVLLNGVLGALSEEELNDEGLILFRLGKSGLRMQAHLKALGLPLTAVCQSVKKAAAYDELPGLDEPPWTAFAERDVILERLQRRAAGWKEVSEASRRKMLLKAITAGIARSAAADVKEAPTRSAPERSSAPAKESAPARPERPPRRQEPLSAEELERLNLAVLNGAIGALSAEELMSEEAICARLDSRQGSLLQRGLRDVGMTLPGVCMFVKAAASSESAPHFDEEMWQRFPGTGAMRQMLQSSAVGWSSAKEITRRKTLLRALTEAMKSRGSTPGASVDDVMPVTTKAPAMATLSVTLDAQNLALVEEVRSRLGISVGMDELMLAGLIGLSEFDEEDIVELIGEVRDAGKRTG